MHERMLTMCFVHRSMPIWIITLWLIGQSLCKMGQRHTQQEWVRIFFTMLTLMWCWLIKSPDLNAIEHIWAFMLKTIRAMNPLPRTAIELRQAVEAAWQTVSQARIRQLVSSMLRRIWAVVEAEGGSTRYQKSLNLFYCCLFYCVWRFCNKIQDT